MSLWCFTKQSSTTNHLFFIFLSFIPILSHRHSPSCTSAAIKSPMKEFDVCVVFSKTIEYDKSFLLHLYLIHSHSLSQTLTHLYLDNNQITDKGVRCLYDVLHTIHVQQIISSSSSFSHSSPFFLTGTHLAQTLQQSDRNGRSTTCSATERTQNKFECIHVMW